MFSSQLTEDQMVLQDMSRKFSANEIAPVAAKHDQDSSFPVDIVQSAIELGLMNLTLDPDYGGSGLSMLDACIVVEELAAGCAGTTTSLIGNDLGLAPIAIAGTEVQKQQFIAPVIEQKGLASFCLTEPSAGSDFAGVRSKLTKVEGGYRLNGAKQWITNSGYAKQFAVFATLDVSLREKGKCCVIVDATADGVTLGKHEDKLGQRASDTRGITFDDVFISQANLVGAEGKGFEIAIATLDHVRPLTASIAVGLSRRAFEFALEYAKERKQFGQPLTEYQIIQATLADAATNLEASRLLVWQAAAKADRGERNVLASTMAKSFAADAAMQIATDAVQIFGGYGYMKEYPVEKLMRDAKFSQIHQGPNQVQRLNIARELLEAG